MAQTNPSLDLSEYTNTVDHAPVTVNTEPENAGDWLLRIQQSNTANTTYTLVSTDTIARPIIRVIEEKQFTQRDYKKSLAGL